jgi:hypothetical protein
VRAAEVQSAGMTWASRLSCMAYWKSPYLDSATAGGIHHSEDVEAAPFALDRVPTCQRPCRIGERRAAGGSAAATILSARASLVAKLITTLAPASAAEMWTVCPRRCRGRSR